MLDAVALHSSEAGAVAVQLRNRSGRAQAVVPVLITVNGADGASVYSNSTPGLATSLVAASDAPAHGTVVWVDDQIQASAPAKGVRKTVLGEGETGPDVAPKIEVTAWHLEHEPGGIALVAGKVANRSTVGQRELVVTALSALIAAGIRSRRDAR